MGPSFSGSGPWLERLALAIGIKPALRVPVPASQADAAAARWEKRGLSVVAARGLLYVARDASTAAALRDAEEAIRARERDGPSVDVLAAHRRLGRLLGYPPCCVDGFLERVARGVTTRRDGTRASERLVGVEDAAERSERFDRRLNVLLPRREALVPFDPCRFDCPVALRYADALLAAYRDRRPEDAADLTRRLGGAHEVEGLTLFFD